MANKETKSKYGRLTLVKELPKVRFKNQTKRIFLCRCDCGNEVAVFLHHLKTEATKSCGCYQADVVAKQKLRIRKYYTGK